MNSALGISSFHHRDIQGLCLQQVFTSPRTKMLIYPLPSHWASSRHTFNLPKALTVLLSHPHGREQIPTATSAAPAQTSLQGHRNPKAEIWLSMVSLRVKHTCYVLQTGLSGDPVFFFSSRMEVKCQPLDSPVFPPFINSSALLRSKFWVSSHNSHTLPPCLIEAGRVGDERETQVIGCCCHALFTHTSNPKLRS